MPEPSHHLIRRLYRRRLRPNKVATYLNEHQFIPPELEKLYREHGITSISTFLHGVELCILVEYDPKVYGRKAAELDAHPLERDWQAGMKVLDDPACEPVEYEEVYRLKAAATRT